MYKVNIYIGEESTAQKEMQRKMAAVLECETAKGLHTREIFENKIGTYNSCTVKMITTAVERLNQSCEIHIYSRNEYVMGAIKNNLHIWAANDWRTKKGTLVKGYFDWTRLWKAISRHLIFTESGEHQYTNWMKEEMKRR